MTDANGGAARCQGVKAQGLMGVTSVVARQALRQLAGEVTKETSDKNGTDVEYEYGPRGERTVLKLNGQGVASYSYDAAGRIETVSRGSKALTFNWDVAGRREWLQYPHGVRTTYGYDARSRLKSKSLVSAHGGAGIASHGYGLEAVGNRTSKTTTEWSETSARPPDRCRAVRRPEPVDLRGRLGIRTRRERNPRS